MGEKCVYIQWSVEIIVGDHDGFCSGNENEEEISSGYIWCSYVLTNDEFNMLATWTTDTDRWLYNIFDQNATALAPDICNDYEGVTGGESYFCDPSYKHRLSHERKRVPLKVTNIIFEHPNTNELFVNLLAWKNILHIIRTVISIFQTVGFPKDVMKLLLKNV